MAGAESFAKAVETSDLAWSALATKPVELAAAMSGASGLGSDIFRSKGHDPAALRRAVLVLAHKSVKAGAKSKLYLSQLQAQAMAVTALSEIIAPHCRVCNGARVMVLDDLKITCPTCDGIGVHRYSDADRARLCNIPADRWHQWQSRYAMVIGIALRHDRAPIKANERLGQCQL